MERLERQTYEVNRIFLMHTTDGQSLESMKERYKNVKVEEITPDEFDHAATRDKGIRQSDADIVICMTQDACPDNEYLVSELVQALEEANRDVRNALSKVEADSKDHEQDRQTDAAYPVSSFRESVQRTLCTLFCLFQLGCPRISGESGTNQKHQTDPDHHKHFSNQNLTIPRPERAGSRQGQQHPC